MANQFSIILESFQIKLSESIDYQQIQGLVRKDLGGFLNKNEFLLVERNRESEDCMRRLIDILKDKDLDDFRIFCTILDISGYTNWAIRLREKAGLPTGRRQKRVNSKSLSDQRRQSNPHVVGHHQRSSSNPHVCDSDTDAMMQKLNESQEDLYKMVGSALEQGREVSVIVKEIVIRGKENTDSSAPSKSPSSGYISPNGWSQADDPFPQPNRFRSPNNSLSSLCGSPTPKTISGFLKHFKDNVLNGLISKQLAFKLCDKELIPESLKKDMLESKDNYEANSLLWQHAEVHYEFEDCICLCDVVRMEKGYPKMTRLGERMRDELLQHEEMYRASE